MYAVIGANGYLGSYIIKNILDLTKEQIIATTRNLSNVNNTERVEWMFCDVQDESSVKKLVNKMKGIQEEVNVVYLAAYHHPDEVQKNQKLAWNINVTALSKFLEEIKENVNCVFYASTDSVYGESINRYRFKEDDKLHPVNFYGHCKCAAESLIIHQGYNVVRFPFLISPSLVNKKHFYDEIVENLRAGHEIEMYRDSYRSSLSFDNASYLLVKLMRKKSVPQIVNICGDNDLSKYEVGRMIAEKEKLDASKVIPITLETVRKHFESPRAMSTLMDNSLLKECLELKQVNIFSVPC